MNNQILVSLLSFYGIFLISSGITAVIFIGMKAKTALISGGSASLASLLTAYLISQNVSGATIAGLLIPAGLFVVFSWRSTKTLYSIFEMIPTSHPDLKGKGIAFLIIALMAVVSLIVFGTQLVLCFATYKA